ncbi:MAG: CsbD family protein [Bdellovibrionaceae bacterium]|nr:CsbD family protein [Pseudobdellovibrionaceae bacterium]
MKANQNVIKGHWLEMKGEIQKAWGRLTDDELEQTKGDMKAVGGLIQQKYGKAEDKTERILSEIYQRFEETKDKSISALKDKLRD